MRRRNFCQIFFNRLPAQLSPTLARPDAFATEDLIQCAIFTFPDAPLFWPQRNVSQRPIPLLSENPLSTFWNAWGWARRLGLADFAGAVVVGDLAKRRDGDRRATCLLCFIRAGSQEVHCVETVQAACGAALDASHLLRF